MCSYHVFRRLPSPVFGSREVMGMALLVLMLSLAPCQATFSELPNLPTNLAKNVTCAAGSCTPSGWDEVTCTDADVCTLKCNTRTNFPVEEDVFMWTPKPTEGTGCQFTATANHSDLPSHVGNGSLEVNNSTSNCSFTNSISVPNSPRRLAFSMWISASCNNCAVVQVQSVVTLRVVNNELCLDTSATCTRSDISGWTFVVLQIEDGTARLSVNGTLGNGPSKSHSSLPSTATVGVDVKSGSDLGSGDSYILADVRYYKDLLTEREMQKLFSGDFPNAGLESDCRCPHTHLKLKQGDNYTCVDESVSEERRLQIEYNAPSVLVNGSGGNWIGPESGVAMLTADLGTTYQVESIELQFYNSTPSPNSIMVELPKGQNKSLTCDSSFNCSLSLALDPDNVTREEFATHVFSTINISFMGLGKNIVSSLRVTGKCNCNGNANTCTPSGDSYQCACNSGTNTNGSQCELCTGNRFHGADQFGCHAECNCDLTGVNRTQTCDEMTGQCKCNDTRRGQKCDECEDDFYMLETSQLKVCTPCNCDPVGRANQVCDKQNGQCPCLGGNFSRTCTPQLVSMEPIYGPQAGMTEVTLRGHNLGNAPIVKLESIEQTVTVHNESMIIFQTMNHTSLASLAVVVSWPRVGQQITLPNQEFSYKPDPVLDKSSLPEVATFVSGGCGVFFKGRNFDSVAMPRISVNGTGGVYYGTCRHVDPDIRCATPEVPNNSDDLQFNLELDGIRELNLGPVTVANDPEVKDNQKLEFQYPFEKTITVEGTGLLGACGADEISVMIGVVGCSIQSLTNTEIECRPPASPPGDGRTFPLTVKIGSNIEKQVGTVKYLEFWETNIFIGIMCGIGALIVLVVVIIVLCCCRIRRRKNQSMRSSRNSHIGLVDKDGAPAPQNQYTTLPQGAVNNGFHADEITAETVIRQPKDLPPPTATEVDLMTEFLQRIEHSLRDGVKASIISNNDLSLGRVCTARGNYARIIDGTFTTVTAGQKTEKKVTIKTLKEPLPDQGLLPAWASAALRECLRLHRHSDDNVLSIMGLALDKQKFHMVYPYMQNRTLKDHIIDTNKEFSVRQLVEFSLQVAEGLNYLAGKDITHRDLAARNCMVDSRQEVKITDAAFSWDFYEKEYVYDSARERYMPLRWMAPESLQDGYYDMRSDVWSLGVLLWELLTRGCLPFHEVEDQSVKEYVLQGYVLGQPQNCSDTLYDLMRQCWDLENEHRPHVSSVVTTLSTELTGGAMDQEDIYVNLGTTEGFYENQMALGGKSRRRAPPPPKTS